MSRTVPQAKIDALAAEYVNNGFQKVAALLAMGYSQNYANTTGLKLYDNIRLKQSIATITSKRLVKSDITVKTLQDDLLAVKAKASDKGDITSELRALELIGKTIGAFIDNLNTTNATIQLEIDDTIRSKAKHIAAMAILSDTEPKTPLLNQ